MPAPTNRSSSPSSGVNTALISTAREVKRRSHRTPFRPPGQADLMWCITHLGVHSVGSLLYALIARPEAGLDLRPTPACPFTVPPRRLPSMKLRYRVRRLAAIGSLTYLSLLVLTVVYLTTPRRVARLIAALCRPEPGMSCYDPCCGSGRLPRAVQSAASRSPGDRIRIFAQEIDPISFIAAAANRELHSLEMTLKLGSSIRHPAFVDGNGGLRRFDLAVASPPWNRSIPEAIYRGDRFERFIYGRPSHDGDWAWMQHILAHLDANGRMVVMLDHEATSRDEDLTAVEVRQRFVESDLIEAVILCPWEISRPRWLVRSIGDSHFVLNSDHKPRIRNSIIGTQQAVLIVVNKAKRRPGEILFVDTRPLVRDYLAGDLTADAVHNAIIDALHNWTTVPGVAEVVSNADVVKSDFTLAPELHCAGHPL